MGAHLGFGHGHRLQYLDHDIAEILEESLGDALALGAARIGKDLLELSANHLVPVPNHIERQQAQKRRECIARPQRPAGAESCQWLLSLSVLPAMRARCV